MGLPLFPREQGAETMARTLLTIACWRQPSSAARRFVRRAAQGRQTPSATYYIAFGHFLRRGLPRRAAGLSVGVPRFDQDGAVAVDRLDLLRDDVRRVLLPDGRVRQRRCSTTPTPWNCSSDFPTGWRRCSFRPTIRAAGRRREEGRPLGREQPAIQLGFYPPASACCKGQIDSATWPHAGAAS